MTRKRIVSERVAGGIGTQGAPVPVQAGDPPVPTRAAGGLFAGIMQGIFGYGDPSSGKNIAPGGEPGPSGGLYHFHEGDLFNPGTGNYVLEPVFDNPLFTVWGKAFLRVPNTFNPVQPPQVWAAPTVKTSGLGGLQAGTMALQPLESEEGQ